MLVNRGRFAHQPNSILFLGVCYAIPSIVEQPTDQKVLQSGDVTLRCVVEGIPHGVENPVQWTKGNFALGYDLLRKILEMNLLKCDVKNPLKLFNHLLGFLA